MILPQDYKRHLINRLIIDVNAHIKIIRTKIGSSRFPLNFLCSHEHSERNNELSISYVAQPWRGSHGPVEPEQKMGK